MQSYIKELKFASDYVTHYFQFSYKSICIMLYVCGKEKENNIHLMH